MATVPTEMTAVAGAVLTAAEWNSNVRDAINFLITPPLCIMRQTATQSIPNTTWTSILLDTEDIDRDGGHSTTVNTSRYTSQTAGYYDIRGAIAWATNATGGRAMRIAANGSAQAGRASSAQASASIISGTVVTGLVYLNVGDYAEIQGDQASGGALLTSVNADLAPSMTVRWYST